MGRLWRRLQFWWNRDRIEADLREEMETHRRLREHALREGDAVLPAARSRRVMGNTTLAVEDAKAVWLWPWLESVGLDLRHGVRGLRRQPTLTLTALLTIAVGSGALTTASAVAYTVLLKPPPYANADRLVQILQVHDGRRRSQVASVDIDAMRSATTLDGVAFAGLSSVSLTGAELPENVRAVETDRHLFPTLGTAPALGRWPSEEDDAGAVRSVVLSHHLWQRRYQGRSDVIGQRLDLNGRPHVILAVMPEQFLFPAPYYVRGDIWIQRSAGHPTLVEPERALMLGFAVLKRGVTRAQAQAEVDVLASQLQSAYPGSHAGVTFHLADWAGSIRQGSRPALLMFIAAAAAVFLIVCINLFNLLLCRGLDRASEMATRASLGAGRGRLARHLVTETVVLFAAGGTAGLLLAVWLAKGTAAIATFDIPRMNETYVGWQVAVASFGLTCVAGLLVGIVPALRASRSGVVASGIANRAVTHHRRGRLIQRLLIASEIGLALVLVCGAGAIATHASTLSAEQAGFDITRLVQARVTLPVNQYPDVLTQATFYRDLLAGLRAHPSIAAAGITDVPPGLAAGASPAVRLGSDPASLRAQDLRPAAIRVISEGYLETLGLRALAGRLLVPLDKGVPLVAVVNETFARTYLADAPVGSRLRVTLDGLAQLDPADREVVGVVADIREDVLYRPAPPTVYIPLTQGESSRMAIVLRAAAGDIDLGPVVRAEVAKVAPGLAVNGLVMPLADLMESEFARTRLSLRLVGGLALIAVILAIVGVYGVTAHGVQHRSREIGIRLALGLTPGAVRRMVLAEGVVLLGVGVAAGSTGAVWTLPLIRSLVVGLDHVPVAGPVAVAALVLTGAVIAGCDLPARRASRVDPATALR